MAYDSQRGRTVLFGGEGPGYGVDTWEWDGTNWIQHFTSGFPPARDRHAMAYDSQRHRVVLFGGFQAGVGYLGDTWEWDGTTWRQLAAGPPARRWDPMAFHN